MTLNPFIVGTLPAKTMKTESRTRQGAGNQRSVAVEVPVVRNLHEYEFLPGHFEVDHIVSEEEGKYNVRLKSGELAKVRIRHFWSSIGPCTHSGYLGFTVLSYELSL